VKNFGSLDSIFNALKVNKTVQEFYIGNFKQIKLNLQKTESLRFLEVNTSIKDLNFENIFFKDVESELLGESLMKNKTITKLNLSLCNYGGKFDFLQNNTLKSFFFRRIWEDNLQVNVKNFLENLKSNHSLIELELSFGFSKNLKENTDIDEFIDIISEHKGNIRILTLNYMKFSEQPIDFHKLLKNPKIKELRLTKSFTSAKSLIEFFNKLNNNNTIEYLDVSENNFGEYYVNWEIQSTQKSIEFLNIECEKILTHSRLYVGFFKESQIFQLDSQHPNAEIFEGDQKQVRETKN
jgi:hypothetical protein